MMTEAHVLRTESRLTSRVSSCTVTTEAHVLRTEPRLTREVSSTRNGRQRLHLPVSELAHRNDGSPRASYRAEIDERSELDAKQSPACPFLVPDLAHSSGRSPRASFRAGLYEISKARCQSAASRSATLCQGSCTVPEAHALRPGPRLTREGSSTQSGRRRIHLLTPELAHRG